MGFVYNFTTADQRFKVILPAEFSLLSICPSEIMRHREQILNYRLKIYSVKHKKNWSRGLYINETGTRVFFNSKANRFSVNNICYYLDELIRLT